MFQQAFFFVLFGLGAGFILSSHLMLGRSDGMPYRPILIWRLQFPDTADLKGEDIQKIKDYLKANQKGGVDLCAADVFKSNKIILMMQ